MNDVNPLERTGFNRQTILLVEDSDDDVVIMQSVFRKAGVPNPLQVVADGEKASLYLRGEKPFEDRLKHPLPIIILLDLKTPKRNGLEFLEWLRGQPQFKKITVHILTASSHSTDVERAFDLGANLFLVKPSKVESLLEMIRAWHALAAWAVYPTIPAD